MYFWYLSKFLLSHESRSIAILDHFQSWKSLQHRLLGWKGEEKFLYSPTPLVFAQPGSQQTYHHSHYYFLPPWCVKFCIFWKKFQCNFMFSTYIECNVMCGGYCHLMNVLSAGPSSLILIHFRGSVPLWLGQKNAFNIEIV